MLMNVNSIKTRDVFDGASNSLLIGEVTGGVPGFHDGWHWPYFNLFPTTFDINGPGSIPAAGEFVRISNDCFSSYHPGGAHFMRVDGSVDFESENIHQAILATLTTRAGGDVISTNGL